MSIKVSLPAQRIIAIVLLFVVAFNALAAGYSFITDPSGGGIGIATDYIRHSPFTTFLIPGIILFIANGLLSLFVAIVAIRRDAHYQDFIYLQGAVLTGWILVQVALVRDFNWMHAACLVIGSILMRFGRQLKQGLASGRGRN